MPRISLLRYVNGVERLGDHVTVTLPNGDNFEGLVLSFNNIAGLETLTIGYGGVASELRQRDELLPVLLGDEQCDGKQASSQQDGAVVVDILSEK